MRGHVRILLAALLAVGCRAEGKPAPAAIDTAAPAPALAPAPSPAASPPATAAVLAAALPCPEGMALVPGGAYRMAKKRRLHRSTVDAFCLDVTEVTVAAYKACVRERLCSPECLKLGQCSAVPTRAEWGEASESQRASRFCNGDRDDRQDHPVNCVSWEESAHYCEAQGKRLPRAEEWEWAARRADPASGYPWGNEPADDQLCWSPRASRHDGTCVVRSHPRDRTPQGVYDLGGDVAEWVDDPAGSGARVHTAFGASWWSMDDGYVSGALGGVEVPSERNETVGFRCARGTSK